MNLSERRRLMMDDKIEKCNGTHLTLTKCKGGLITDFEISGKSVQTTTTGAQLLDLPDSTGVRNGLTHIIKNGIISISGTPSGKYSPAFSTPITLTPGTYYISGGDAGHGHVYAQIGLTVNGKTSYYINKTFDVTGEETNILFAVQSGEMSEIDNYVLYPMLNAGSSPLLWEPFTGGRPSPNRSYPQEIKGVEHVLNSGAQLLDIKLPPITTKHGVTISLTDDGGIRLSGTATGSGNHRLIDPSQNIALNFDCATLSLQTNGDYDGVVMVSDASEGDWKSLLSTKNNTSSTGAIHTSKLGCYVTYVAGTTYNVTLYPMLNKGNVAIPWERYNNGQRVLDINVNITGKNMLPVIATTKTIAGVTFTVNEDKSITVNGTANKQVTYHLLSNSYDDITTGIENIVNNTNYTLSNGYQIDTKKFLEVGITYDDGTKYYINTKFHNPKTLLITKKVIGWNSWIRIESGETVDNVTFYPMFNQGTSALPYDSYRSQSITIHLAEPLHSIGDARDRIISRNGVWGIERNVIVAHGAELMWVTHPKWVTNFENSYFSYAPISDALNISAYTPIMSPYFAENRSINTRNIEGINFWDRSVRVRIANITTLEELVAWMQENNPIFLAQRAEPTWEPFPDNIQAQLAALHTFIPISIVSNNADAEMTVQYRKKRI